MEMKKFNKIWGSLLGVISIISIAIVYNNQEAAIPVSYVGLAVAACTTFIVCMQVANYHGYEDYNPGKWWFTYSVCWGLCFIGLIYAAGFHLIPEHVASSILCGNPAVLAPVIGLFLAQTWKSVFRGEELVI